MRVSGFGAECRACGHAFVNPLLSDFAYGELLLHGERGRAVVHLDSLDEPAWDVVKRLVPGPFVDEHGYPNAGRLHWVIARLVDPVDGERFLMTLTCPQCLSHDIRYGAGEVLATIDVPSATFSQFLSLPADEQAALVESLLREYEGMTDVR